MSDRLRTFEMRAGGYITKWLRVILKPKPLITVHVGFADDIVYRNDATQCAKCDRCGGYTQIGRKTQHMLRAYSRDRLELVCIYCDVEPLPQVLREAFENIPQ